MSANHNPADVQPDDNLSAASNDPSQPADAGAQSEDPLATLTAALQEAQAQLAEQRDLVLRAHADMENVRRRAADEVSKARKFGLESFAESLVPVKDSLEAALAQTEQSLETMREGVEVTLKQLVGAFDRNHLKEIAPQAGEKFDPHHHQAIATVPADQEANTVVQVLQKGYSIADRVLRPALVTVAAG